MTLDGMDIRNWTELILEALENAPEVANLTDAEAARQVRRQDSTNYDPSADLATMSEDDLEKRKRMVRQQLTSLTMPIASHKNKAEFFKKQRECVPETIRAMQKHLKKLEAHYDALIANEEKLGKAADAYESELNKRIEAVDAEMRGRQPITYAEVQELLKQAREGKA